MSNISWERKLELWAIAQCNAAGTLPVGLQLRPHDDAGAANEERIYFEATTGNQNPPAATVEDGQVYDTLLLAEFRSTNRDATETDAIFAELMAIFSDPDATVPENGYFTAGLWFDQEESQNARSDGQDTRNRSRTFTFQVGHDDTAQTVVEDDAEVIVTDDADVVVTST